MQDGKDGLNKEDIIVLDLARTAEMRITLFVALASIAAFLAFRSEPILLWQTPVFLVIAAIAALLEKDCAIWFERRLNEEIRSRQDSRWRQRWKKNFLQFRGLSFLCFAGAILFLVPVIWQYQ